MGQTLIQNKSGVPGVATNKQGRSHRILAGFFENRDCSVVGWIEVRVRHYHSVFDIKSP
jgi:hypothetical protein